MINIHVSSIYVDHISVLILFSCRENSRGSLSMLKLDLEPVHQEENSLLLLIVGMFYWFYDMFSSVITFHVWDVLLLLKLCFIGFS